MTMFNAALHDSTKTFDLWHCVCTSYTRGLDHSCAAAGTFELVRKVNLPIFIIAICLVSYNLIHITICTLVG